MQVRETNYDATSVIMMPEIVVAFERVCCLFCVRKIIVFYLRSFYSNTLSYVYTYLQEVCNGNHIRSKYTWCITYS
jgi:hypothetical protein